MATVKRVDEAGGTENLDRVIELHKEALGYLSKTYALESTIIKAMNGIFRELHQLVKDEPELFNTVQLAFGSGSAFNQWVQKLPRETQEKFKISSAKKDSKLEEFKKEFSEVYAYLRIQDFFQPASLSIHIGDHPEIEVKNQTQIAYIDKRYLEATKSDWLRNHRDQRAAQSIEEFVRSDRVFLLSVMPMIIILNETLPKLSHPKILESLQGIEQLHKVFSTLKLNEILEPADQSIEETLKKLIEKYQSKEFQYYQRIFDQLQKTINELPEELKNKLNTYSSPLFQRIMRYPLLFKELNKTTHENNADIISAINTAELRAAASQVFLEANSLLNKSSSNPRGAALKGILQSENVGKTYKKSQNPEDSEDAHRSNYLKELLIIAFPDVFEKSEEYVFKAKSPSDFTNPDDVKEKITKEITLTKTFGFELNKDWHLINPEKFNLQINLKTLDPVLYSLLGAIKPISQNYSLEAKVSAYRDFIKAIKDGKIRLDYQSIDKQIEDVAKQVLDLTQKRLAESPHEDTPTLRSAMTDIGNSISSSFTSETKKAYDALSTETPLKKLLNYPQLTTLDENSKSQYLKNLLIEVFPTVFQESQDKLMVISREGKMLENAMGFSHGLNPNNFNQKELAKITISYLNSVLKAISPINSQPGFLIEHKILAYKLIIEGILNRKLQVDSTSQPIKQARIVADLALDIVIKEQQKNPNESLLLNQALVGYLNDISKQIRRTATAQLFKGAALSDVEEKYQNFLNPAKTRSPTPTSDIEHDGPRNQS